jgi:hypothetical protein
VSGVIRTVLQVDEPRLLHRRSELGYTRRSPEALEEEPEAVDADTQARLTRESRRRATLDRLAAWRSMRDRLEDVLDEARAAFGPLIANELRGIRRELDRVDARLRD